VTTAFRPQPEAQAAARQASSLVQIGSAQPELTSIAIPDGLKNKYIKEPIPGGLSAARPFHSSLLGIAVSSRDNIYALGDGEVRIFQPNGNPIGHWKAPDHASCLAISPEKHVLVGSPGRVDIYSSAGNPMGSFTVGETGQPASITAIKTFGKEVLVADASAKIIRRYDRSGKHFGTIGTQGKITGFIIPNHSLDIDVDAKGDIYATDSGRHRVTSWGVEGSLKGKFGKFGHNNPEDFVGCCNPVNLAVMPDGKVVTAEKVAARVKVYSPDGRLLALIGPEHFDLRCTRLHLAVDSKGRILVSDPIRQEINVFSPAHESESGKSV
jgi:sugar lactone lactonase YvrE